MDRLLRNSTGMIRLEIYNTDGVAQDATGAVGVTVRDGAGVDVVTGVATKPAGTTGQYEFGLTPANVANLDLYRAIWSAVVSGSAHSFITEFEVVGGFLFTVSELRGLDKELSDVTKYPHKVVVATREGAEEWIEDLCNFAFRPRGRRSTLDGSGRDVLILDELFPIKVVSAKVGGTAFTPAEISEVALYPWGGAVRKNGVWEGGNRNVEIHYEHGLSQPPEPIRRAAMLLTRHILVNKAAPDRTESITTDVGTFRLAVAGEGKPTGIPEVDAVIAQLAQPAPALG